MITLRNVSKSFNSKKVLDNLTLVIPKGSVFGLVGPNGSGKSTILRLLCGVYQLDEGFISIGDMPVYDNTEIKKLIFFVADEPYYPTNSTLHDLKQFYTLFYPNFSNDKYKMLLKAFPISENIKLSKMSKGMKRQAILIIALACNPLYLFLDEAFDGLDPVMRLNLKKIISDDISERKMSVIISSHNLRELEDICDNLGLLNDGNITLSGSREELANLIFKVQVGFSNPIDEAAFESLNIQNKTINGSIMTFITKSPQSEINAIIEALSPVLFEYLPMSLEEIFIYEMEVNGYGKFENEAQI